MATLPSAILHIVYLTFLSRNGQNHLFLALTTDQLVTNKEIEQERQLQYTHIAAGIIGVISIRYRIASAHYAMYYTHTAHYTRQRG